jgi:hypothetical protein
MHRLTVLIAIALVGLGATFSSTFGGRIHTKSPRAKTAAAPLFELKSYPKVPVVSEPQQPTPTLTVKSHPDTPNALVAIHGRIAKLMTGNVEVIPPTRSSSVEWLAGSGLVVKGWRALITDSVPIAGGRLVTLQVTPVFPHTFRASTHVIEKYAVYDNGAIHLVEALPADPAGPRVITSNLPASRIQSSPVALWKGALRAAQLRRAGYLPPHARTRLCPQRLRPRWCGLQSSKRPEPRLCRHDCRRPPAGIPGRATAGRDASAVRRAPGSAAAPVDGGAGC